MIRLREDVGNARQVPGSRWLVRYPDDPDWWNQRVFAWPITTTRWVVRTADGDQYDEAFGDYEKMVPLDNSGRYPDGVVQTPQEPSVLIDWWGSEEAVPGNSWVGGVWRRIRGQQVVQRPTSEVRKPTFDESAPSACCQSRFCLPTEGNLRSSNREARESHPTPSTWTTSGYNPLRSKLRRRALPL